MVSHNESWPRAFLTSVFKNNRKYGGYVVHLGMVFIFLGIAGSAYKEVREYDLTPGESVSFKEYTVHFKDFENFEYQNQIETYAVVDLYIGARLVSTLRPARFFYKKQEQPSTEVDIYSRLKEDVYFTIGSVNPETGKTKIHAILNPLISWLWLGGLILVIGGVIAMLPPLVGRKEQI